MGRRRQAAVRSRAMRLDDFSGRAEALMAPDVYFLSTALLWLLWLHLAAWVALSG